MSEIDGWKAFQVLGGLYVGLVSWIGARYMRRLDDLENRVVSREDFKDAMAQIRSDRQDMHKDNQTRLDRMECAMNDNAARDAQTRHNTNEAVHTMSTQLAVLIAQAKDAKERDKETRRGS